MVVNDRRKFFVQQPFFRLSKLVLGGGLALQILEAEKDLGSGGRSRTGGDLRNRAVVWGSWGSESGCVVITGPVWCSIGCGAGVDRDRRKCSGCRIGVGFFCLLFETKRRREKRREKKKEKKRLAH